MSTPVYIALQNPDVSWMCDHCGMPNFSNGLFAPSISESQNSFEALSDTNMNTSSSTMDLGSHVHASSPNTRPLTRKGTPLLKVLSLNCNSVKGKDKNCEFRVLIDQHYPHVILGCESKIDSTLSTYSLFPDHYTEVYRKDRTRARGGVFCAIREDVLASEERDLDRENECIWGSVQFAKSQKLYLGSFYRPPRAPVDNLEELENSLTDLFSRGTRRHPSIVIAGDFNAPDIDWANLEVNGNNNAINARKLLGMVD